MSGVYRYAVLLCSAPVKERAISVYVVEGTPNTLKQELSVFLLLSCCPNNKQHTAKHLVLQDGGRKYMGGIEELVDFVQSAVAPPFDRSEDDRRDWVAIAQEQCEVRNVSRYNHEPDCLSNPSLDYAKS